MGIFKAKKCVDTRDIVLHWGFLQKYLNILYNVLRAFLCENYHENMTWKESFGFSSTVTRRK